MRAWVAAYFCFTGVLCASEPPQLSSSVGNRPATAWIAAGDQAMLNDDLDEAIECFSKALKAGGSAAEKALAHSSLAVMWTRKGEWQKALKAANEAVALEPDNAVHLYNRVLVHRSTHEYVKAIADLDEVIRLRPELAKAYNDRGFMRSQLGDLEAAGKDFDQAIELDPDSTSAHNNRGHMQVTLGRLQEALRSFDEAIRLDPKNGSAYSNRAVVYQRMKMLDKAIKDFDRALEINPQDMTALSNRATCHQKRFAWRLALEDAQRVLASDDKDVAMWNLCAVVWSLASDAEVRDGDRAVMAGIKACELSQWKNWMCLSHLAAAYAEKGEFDQALKALEKGMALAELPKDGSDTLQRQALSYLKKVPLRFETPL